MAKKPLTDEMQAEAAKVVPIKRPADDWQDGFKLTNDGAVKRGSIYNVRLILKHDPALAGVIAYDEFSDQIIKPRAATGISIQAGYWDDNDSAVLRAYLEERYNLLFSRDNIFDAVIAAAKTNVVNPIKQRIEGQSWDGTPRAARYFIDYLGAEDNAYNRAIAKTWLTGAVARIYRPGCKFEIVPILEGGQGIGKSTAARNLCPSAFSDSLRSLGKSDEDYKKLQGAWVIELGELSALKQSEIESTKGFISAQSDVYRPSYGKFSTPHPRRCVFIGTTNQTDYLRDATGERRFFPIRCGVTAATKDVWHPDQSDIAQILAEAKHWLEAGEPTYLAPEIMRIAKPYQEAAQVIDPLKEAITSYLNMMAPANYDDLSDSDKHRYFEDWQDNRESSDWLASKFSGQSLAPLNRTTAGEILAVVFGKRPDTYLTGRTNSQAKHIKVIMDNMPGWRYNQNVILHGRRARGYSRDP